MKKYQPTNSELEILSVLWEKGSATTRQVHEIIAQNKKVGYTSTLKTMQNMHEKELLSRQPQGQTHLYSPAVEQSDIQQVMLGGFVNKLFNGSAKNLILQTLGNQKPSRDELDEIRAMLDKLENDGDA
ncbi:BlaI/MecI/CopY family transcriptional regulator [Ekhidna sp. To15]|uniref:BlaI/MecI/CopY family transcriptional regulator n=1 Tax=Ekhidna sp. To15 TaxID=3395267 RepID=UPI003F51C3D1